MISRRGLIQGSAGMSMRGRGGLTPRRPDQAYRPPSQVTIAPGAKNVIRARQVIISGPGGGLFVYNGAPGRGTLIVAATGQSGLDPTGKNTVPAVLNIGKWDAATGLLDQHSGFDTNGDLFVVGANIQFQDIAGNLQSAIMVPSRDTTGAADPALIASFFAAGASEVHLMPGTYYTNTQITLKEGQYLRGSGMGSTVINSLLNPAGNTVVVSSSTGTSVTKFGGVSDLTIDGAGAASGSNGLQAGDIVQLQFSNVCIQNFAGGSGAHFVNQHTQTEQMHGTLFVANCFNAVHFDVSGGTVSFDRPDLAIWVNLFNGQTAVFLNNGAQIIGGKLGIYGNMASSGGGGFVINTAGTNPVINSCNLDIEVESDNATNAPTTIHFVAGTALRDNYGTINFDFGGANHAFQPSNVAAGQFIYQGPVRGDATLLSTPYYGEFFAGAIGNGSTLFAQEGGVIAANPAANVSGIVMQVGLRAGQQVTIINQSGFTITFDVTVNSHVADGIADMIPATTARTFTWDTGTSLWYRAA